MLPDLEQLEIGTSAALWDWLGVHHGQGQSVLLVTWKKAAGALYVGREDVLDALIAYGWVDGRRYKHEDAVRTIQLISPRGQQVWAQTYKARALRLEQDGRMHASGLKAISDAMASGKWNAGQDVDALIVPDDLSEALRGKQSRDAFDAYAPSYRRNVLRWLKSAKREETRAKRILEITSRTAKDEKVPQF